MSKEKLIIISSCITSFLLLLFLTPKNKVRHACLIFLFQQSYTLITGLIIVEKGFIRYPKDMFFKNSYKGSFPFEQLVFPAITVLFNIYYPSQKKSIVRVLYYFIYCSFITSLEVIAVRFTRLITFKDWHWYWSFITMGFSFYISRIFYKWFFKNELSEGIS
ncbi:MAG: CBO0543 family protein [Bacillota bacterium]